MCITQKSQHSKIARALAGSAILILTFAIGCGGSAPVDSTASGSATTPASADPNLTAGTATTPPAPANPGERANTDHHRCGWIGADHAEEGTAAFLADPDYYQAIHPKWFTLDPNGTPRSNQFLDDPRIVETAHAHHVLLMPLIDADTAQLLRDVLASPSRISAHAQVLADLVAQHGYDGIELDYEHLWSASDRAPFTELVNEVAAKLHAEGKKLSMAVPAIDHDDGNNAYDYAALNRAADVLHLMAYDYHYLGGDHLGPLAPLGWVDAVAKRASQTGDPSKYLIGVANYGIGGSFYTLSASDAQARCTGPIDGTTDHMLHCSYGKWDAGRAPHCQTAGGPEWFEDAGSVAEKAAVARKYGLGGMTFWTIGGEPAGYRDAIRAAFPN